jgi:hypothetical protein
MSKEIAKGEKDKGIGKARAKERKVTGKKIERVKGNCKKPKVT